MLDRFITNDPSIVAVAAEALCRRLVFHTIVHRPDAEPPVQHWRGYVISLTQIADDVQIEVNRFV